MGSGPAQKGTNSRRKTPSIRSFNSRRDGHVGIVGSVSDSCVKSPEVPVSRPDKLEPAPLRKSPQCTKDLSSHGEWKTTISC